VPSAAKQLGAAIAAAGGAIPFNQFMQISLYGENGFYTNSGKAGRRGGDFITSPEVGPLFGTVIARALDAWWIELGSPSSFDVVECGAGPGTLARSILAAKPRCLQALNYVAVEVSAAQRALHPEGVESREAMPDHAINGVILANELLDNLPFRLFVFDGTWMEAFVAQTPDGAFVEVLHKPSALPAVLPQTAALGSRVPIQDAACAWVSNALSLIERGSLLLFDYCTDTTAAVAAMPWRKWLRTYEDHERGGHYLLAPGSQDITAQVVLDQLPGGFNAMTQAQFLQQLGIDELVLEGKAYWEQLSGAPDVAAMKMRSRAIEHDALTDMNSLGSTRVLIWQRTEVK
jgi:SAM-dependent MidA family methyltransferase